MQYNYLIDKNIDMRRSTGVDLFHKAGYYGEGIISSTCETWDLDLYNPGNQVTAPFGSGSRLSHGAKAAAVFFQVAPKAKLVMFKCEAVLNTLIPENSYDDFAAKILPYIKEHNIHQMFNAFKKRYDNHTRRQIEDKFSEMPDFKCIFSTGLRNSTNYNPIIELPEIFGCIARFFSCKNDEEKTNIFSSIMMSFINTDLESDNKDKEYLFSGSSCATPWLAGMLCLVDEFFIDKTGKPLSKKSMEQFLHDYSIYNDYVVLPDPKTIDIEKYI